MILFVSINDSISWTAASLSNYNTWLSELEILHRFILYTISV